MLSANKGVSNVNVKELKAKLSEEFEVTESDRGIIIKNLIEEYQLPAEEVNLMLQDLGLISEQVDVRYFITDENNQFVHACSIKKISATEYSYVSYPKVQITYNLKRASIALSKLQNANLFAKMNNTFRIESTVIPTTLRFVIQDQETGNYISSDSVFVTKNEILYSSHTGRADGLEYSNSMDVATQIASKVKSTLAKYDIHKKLEIVPVVKGILPNGEMVIEHIAR